MFGRRFKLRRTTIITLGLATFLGGLGFARTDVHFSDELLIIVALFFLISIARLRVALVISTALFGFTLGWWRGQAVLKQLEPLKTFSGQHIVATVEAENDAVYDNRQELSFDAGKLHVSDPADVRLPGRLLIAGFGEPAVYKGDIVGIEGKIYASRGSHQLRMSFAQLKVLGRSASSIDTARRKYAAGMESALPEPQASFGLGLLMGQRNTMPASITTQLAAVGLTHIIAVSGYNLTIIMRAVRRILNKRSKYQTTVLSLVLMGLFLLTTGFSASIVRAAIVSSLSLLAWYYGRSFRPLLLIVLAASLTAGWNPLYIWSDIGWYLSFLAFFGVLIIAPLINIRLFGKKEPKALTGLLTESLCALIMTIPFVLYIFHQVSLVALMANLLVVPLVPLAMLLALMAGLAGMLWPVLAGIVAWPARVLLTYMLDLVQLMSRIPHALVQRQLSLVAMLFLYGCVSLFAFVLWRATEKSHAILTPESMESDA
ncbi:MAG TPA: ComEC/Rec2 family competence protein [Candidatus Saccharimonadales bacterium]|nr:ComEC/Rec2 family competence protein [Candidatus Saccharimonadales bacterium]